MRWEYETLKVHPGGLLGGKIDVEDLAEVLNSRGRDGWELVSAFDTNYGNGASREVILVLKRPLD